jgi:hypothetical protein
MKWKVRTKVRGKEENGVIRKEREEEKNKIIEK